MSLSSGEFLFEKGAYFFVMAWNYYLFKDNFADGLI